MKTLACCLVVSLIGCASSTTGKALNVAVIGSGVSDYATTRYAIGTGRAREANPLVGHGAIQQAVVKTFGVSAILAAATLADLKGSPLYAHVIRGLAIGVWTWASWHNWRTVQ